MVQLPNKIRKGDKMRLNKKGFTLIELIIVVIIIGILAAIAAPMMSGNVKRAKQSEAIAAMGAIRTALRLYTASSGGANNATSFTDISPYIMQSDLSGQYYGSSDYSFGSTQINASNAVGPCNMTILTGTISQ